MKLCPPRDLVVRLNEAEARTRVELRPAAHDGAERRALPFITTAGSLLGGPELTVDQQEGLVCLPAVRDPVPAQDRGCRAAIATPTVGAEARRLGCDLLIGHRSQLLLVGLRERPAATMRLRHVSPP